jgi:RNA recognition motif-containing protein
MEGAQALRDTVLHSSSAPSTPTPTPLPDPTWMGRNIYIRNMPAINIRGEYPSEPHVYALCSQFGEVERIKIIRDRTTNQPIGEALCLFKEQEAAYSAVSKLNSVLFAPIVAKMWLPKECLK